MRLPLIPFWTRLSLAKKYALMSLLVLIAGMWLIGSWVSAKIETGVIDNTAITAALYLNSFVAPELQELASHPELSAATIATLHRLYKETQLNERVTSFKIWALDGRVLYSSNPAIIGRVFPIAENKEQAWNGAVVAEFAGLDYAENILERGQGLPLLEIYSPVRDRWSNRIIAVAEFYDDATLLTQQLVQARVESWLVVAAVSLAMFFVLFGIVWGGNRTIERQRQELQGRVQQLSELLTQNKQLHDRAQRATSRAVELNERFLRRLSAELHDGPAQALSFGLLRLDAIADNNDHAARAGDLERIRNALREALQEIRNLSTGLAVPELAELGLLEALQKVVRAHLRRTRSNVELCVSEVPLPNPLPLPLKIGIYRFVQEALNNAYQHGKGQHQHVQTRYQNGVLEVEVSDAGPGFDPEDPSKVGEHLGLSGMRERIESLGGHFQLDSVLNRGTRVIACLPIAPEAMAYA